MKTPEDEMSFIARNSLDVHAANAASCAVAVAVAWMGLRQLLLAFRKLLNMSGDRFSGRDGAVKQKRM